MDNLVCQNCGGCVFRNSDEATYRKNKEDDFKKTIGLIQNAAPVFDEPVFISDGSRRRAEMTFQFIKKHLVLGFNQQASHNVIDIQHCPLLVDELNSLLPKIRAFLEELCSINTTRKVKSKLISSHIQEGDIHLLKADNGIDIILHIKDKPELEHRLLIADFVNQTEGICRVSWQTSDSYVETITEKTTPEIYIAGYTIRLPQSVFLQASKASENIMIEKVLSYLGTIQGKIADLFCGLGTFTYPLSKLKNCEVISADSYEPSLKGLKNALNFNQIHNVSVVCRNLFKYPFDKDDFKDIHAVVIDPPRAGAHEQCREITKLPDKQKPQKIVFVSCNPKTFTFDAELLINAGYHFERVVLIDQFVYSKHQELIALFTLT